MTARALARETGDYEQDVAAKLRGYLAEKRISKHDLAARLGQSEFWVGRRINGRTPITVGELALIADALQEPMERFLPPTSGATPNATDQKVRGSNPFGRASRHGRRSTDRPNHLRIVV